jgi:glycosyltransferase involved in cell wall biosynthesis
MRIAFYAPLKPPDSPTPSGDRRIARLLVQALERAGHDVTVLSRFRSFEGGADAARARRIRDVSLRLAERYARRLGALSEDRRPEAVLTYHVYDKAPDWIGPGVARALGVPYLIAEASLNPGRAKGALAIGHEGAKAAVATADAVLELNPADRAGVATALKPGARIWPLAPFTEPSAPPPAAGPRREALARGLGLDPALPWILTVAMMRPGDKLASYRVLAEALGRLADRPWRLLVAGDGSARAQVEDAFRALGADRVRFLGLREGDDLAALYPAADIFAWPAVNEALGMAILEAQAHGLPAVAGAHGAIGAIIEDGVTGLLAPEGAAASFAAALARLLDAPSLAARMGEAAAARAAHRHGIGQASETIDAALRAASGLPARKVREPA